MGNLFTHVVRRNNQELSLLSRLRQLYRNTPRDQAEINKLKKKLRKIKTVKKTKKSKVLKTSFSWRTKKV